MGFLNNLLGKIFGEKQQKVETSVKRNDHYLTRWENKRQERIKSAEARLKDWIAASLQGNENLPFSWESGNDEAFVTFQDYTDAEEDNFQDLEEYIIDKLDIPDAGEFKMNGSGKIYLENNLVKVKYSSVLKGVIDFNEVTEEEIYREEELDSGDQVLFSI